MKEYCKSIKVYPIGNLTLSNASMACMESMHETSTPLWIGIVRDIYQNKEQGMIFLVINTFSTCQVFSFARMNFKSLVNENFCLALKYLLQYKRLHLFQPSESLCLDIFEDIFSLKRDQIIINFICLHVPTTIYNTIYYTLFYNA